MRIVTIRAAPCGCNSSAAVVPLGRVNESSRFAGGAYATGRWGLLRANHAARFVNPPLDDRSAGQAEFGRAMIGGDNRFAAGLVYVAAELLGQASDRGDRVRSLADLGVHLRARNA